LNYKLIGFSEIDPAAIKSYCAIHSIPDSLNLGDVSKVSTKDISNFNIMTWGFPCVNISKAGNLKGFQDEEGNITKSGLYYEGMRILKDKNPYISIIENVANLLANRFEDEFNTILDDLDKAGYNTYCKVLCAKNYDIPQSRERVFIVSIRKDIDNGKFEFPVEQELYCTVQDFLEENVSNEYYMTQEQIDNNQLLKLGKYLKTEMDDSVPISQATTKGYINCKLGGIADLSYPTSKTRRGRVQGDGDLCPTLTATKQGLVVIESSTRIRELTAKERLRLMGFDDKDYELAKESGVTDNKISKQAGNSIVTTIPYYIFKELYRALPNIMDDVKMLSLFSGIGSFEKGINRLQKEINT
jgi:DNA (cytosine-5)-methyltransferase 1